MGRAWRLAATGLVVLLGAPPTASWAQRFPAAPTAAVAFTAFKPQSVYAVGERVGWTVTAPLGTGATRYSYVVRENNATELKSGILDLSSGQGVIDLTLDHPGMVYARLT